MDLKIGSTSVYKMYKGSVEVAKGYLGSNLIYSSEGSTPLTNANFYTARDLWFTDQAQAEATYGLIENWNTTGVTNMSSAFLVSGVVTNDFNKDLSSWDVSNVTNMGSMFRDADSFNQDIGAWDVSSVINMYQMFYNAQSFNQDIGSWDVSSVITIWSMFSNATALDTSNYDLILIGWEAGLQSQFPNGSGYSKTPSVSFVSAKYTGGSASATARASLVNNFNWTITDGGTV